MPIFIIGGGSSSSSTTTPTTANDSGIMTLSDIRAEVLQWLDESEATSTDAVWTTTTNAIKQAQVIRLTEDKWPFMLWDRQETITLVAAQRAYSLHQLFSRPLYIRNQTRKTWMTEMPGRNIEPSGVEPSGDTNTDRYTIWGRSPVKSQPSSASVIKIVSTSDLDTSSSKAIAVRGDTTDGVTTDIIIPTGTVMAVGVVPFTKILEVNKGASWTGTMTMTSNSGAVTNLTLFPNEFARSYPQLNLLYQPTAGEVLEYQFYRQPNVLTHEGSVSSVPPPFERILVFDALLLMAAYDNRLDGGRAALWREMRDQLDFALRQAMMEGSSLGAEPRFIRDSCGYPQPRINDFN